MQEPPNLQGLVNEIEPSALGSSSFRSSPLAVYRLTFSSPRQTESVPASVRSEIEGMLQKFVEKNVE